jgi:hypothetical protein
MIGRISLEARPWCENNTPKMGATTRFLPFSKRKKVIGIIPPLHLLSPVKIGLSNISGNSYEGFVPKNCPQL